MSATFLAVFLGMRSLYYCNHYDTITAWSVLKGYLCCSQGLNISKDVDRNENGTGIFTNCRYCKATSNTKDFMNEIERDEVILYEAF